MKKTLIIILLFASSLAAVCPPIPQYTRDVFIFRVKKQVFENSVYTMPLTTSLLYEGLIYAGIKEPDIVYKQAIIETGWFTSELFTDANNIFGMRMPRVRPTTAIGEYDYHAAYTHWYDSIKDYILFQDYYLNRGYSFSEYLLFLEDIGYATDTLYTSKLKSIS